MLGSNTKNRGVYGAGIYFSAYPLISLRYSRNYPYVLCCQVLFGKAFRHQGGMGCPLTEVC